VSNEPLPGVFVTAREIYDAVVMLRGKLDVLIAQREGEHHQLQDMEARVRQLERRQWPLPTIAVLVAVASAAVAIWSAGVRP
jgi:hypothetical protein